MSVTHLSPTLRAPVVAQLTRPDGKRATRRVLCRAADTQATTTTAPETKEMRESREILDSFFVGKSLAETLLERAGSVFTDALSEVSRFDADNREQIRAFQDEVLSKAREESQRGKRKDDGMR
jgi:hypothetical protein